MSALVLFGCAPVLDRQLMDTGQRNVAFTELRRSPEQEKGRLFILGGVIVGAKFVASGLQIEAVDVPVDSLGYFEDGGRSEGRFLAVAAKDDTSLDPVLLRKGARFTMAGEFVDLVQAKIDEMPYAYPVFRIRQLYLWPREVRYAYPPPYPPGFYDPWDGPWMYPYGPPPDDGFYGGMFLMYP